MKITRKGSNIEVDFRWGNERIRRIGRMADFLEFLEHGLSKIGSNLGELNKKIIFKEFVEKIYLKKSKAEKKPDTYRTETDSVNQLNLFFANMEIHTITAGMFEEYKLERLSGKLSKIGKRCSNCTVNKELSTLNQILEHAMKLKHIRANPLVGTRKLPPENRKDKWLRINQIEQLLAACKGKLKDFVEFLILIGARVNEALKFNAKKDFNESKSRIRLETLKRKKKKELSFRWLIIERIGERLANLLERMQPHPETGYFFHNKNGEPLADSTVRHYFERARKKAGLPDRVLQDLRHTFTMHRAIGGIDFWQLRAELGQVSANAIQSYLDDAHHYDKTESIFYRATPPELSVLENGKKRTEKRTEITNKGSVLHASK